MRVASEAVIDPGATGRDERLAAVLEESRRRGFLGPASINDQITHSMAFAAAVRAPDAALDLGAGGGLPGLVLARLVWAGCRWTLLDARAKRCKFLTWAVGELDLADRVEVLETRAEAAGRDPAFRHRFDLVVARSFGVPAVVAECAAPLLTEGGQLVVSEPPAADPRARAGLTTVSPSSAWARRRLFRPAPTWSAFPCRSGARTATHAGSASRASGPCSDVGLPAARFHVEHPADIWTRSPTGAGRGWCASAATSVRRPRRVEAIGAAQPVLAVMDRLAAMAWEVRAVHPTGVVADSRPTDLLPPGSRMWCARRWTAGAVRRAGSAGVPATRA